MQISDVLALLFGLVTVIGVVYAVLTYRQQSPKRRVTLSTGETQLISAQVSDFGEMSIFHEGHEVKDPRFVDVSIEATGRADVPSERFDASIPLVLDCGRPILAYTGRDAGAVLKIDHQKIAFGPLLLKKGVPTKIRLLIDGPSSCEWEDPKLIDTKVQFVSDPAALKSQLFRQQREIMIERVSSLLMVVGALIAAFLAMFWGGPAGKF